MSDVVVTPPAKTPPVLKACLHRWGHRLQGALFYIFSTFIVDTFLLLESTMDVRIYGRERLSEIKRAGKSPLMVIWHGQGLLPMALFRQEHLCLYASHTREEHYARSLRLFRWWTLRFIERLGYKVMDASEFKSEARGVMQFVEILKRGTGSVIAADGPAGPIYQAKPGAPYLARKSGVLLLPVGSAISAGIQMDQWDRFEIPYPFARSVIVIGEPILVPATGKDAELEEARLQLEIEMNRCVREARAKLHLPPLEILPPVESV